MWLRNEDHTVLVSPQGGSILGWWWRKYPILGPPQIKNINGKLKLRGETHWRYPNFGTVNPEVRPEHQQPKHGLLRHALLDVIPLGTSVQFKTRPAWRGEGAAGGTVVKITVDLRGVQVFLWAMNEGAERAPILPALHPYFAVPKGGLAVYMGTGTISYVHDHGVSRGVSEKARVIERTGPVSVELKGIGTVDLALPDDCTHIVLWSDLPSEYICVEPVFGTPGSYGTEQGRWLKPGESTKCAVEFSFTPNPA